MAVMDTLRGLIALVAAAGGRVDARIKIQKEAYLLAAFNAEGFDRSSFSYYHYGPYSREISDSLQFAVSSNLLTEIREPGAGSGIRYSYSLTPLGRHFLMEAGELNEREASLVREMDQYHWRALELAATVRFLGFGRGAVDQEEALSEALQLKPETTPYRNDALKLLDRMKSALAS